MRRLHAIVLFILTVLVTTRSAPALAQDRTASLPSAYLQGYARAISGEVLIYHWAYPGHVPTLLSRATDGSMRVEWEGDARPPGYPGETITYAWHAGLNGGPSAGHAFTVAVNGTAVATIRTRGIHDEDARAWTVSGRDGATVSFAATSVGTFDELFGFMWLTAPRALFGEGAPRFSVTGEAAGSQDYYLGPEQRLEEWVRITPEQVQFADGRQGVRVSVSYLGRAQDAAIHAGGTLAWSGRISPGHTSVLARVAPPAAWPAQAAAAAPGTVPLSVPVTLTVGGAIVHSDDVAIAPVRAREFHLLPHSHVDIGYSDPQPVVERKQWQNLRDAVALAKATAAYPAEARFKWNVEGLWSVESYLAQASAAERDDFAAAIRGGSIGIQPNYTNVLTGLATPEELRRWTDAHARLQHDLGIPPGRTAMHSDIPGVSWTVVSALASAGVRYFSSGPNYVPSLPGQGDRIGATLDALGDRPFWWTSPSGEDRLLFWMAGRGYSWFHGLNSGPATERSRDALLEYARALAAQDYPYDLVQVRYTIGGDNGPVDRALPDFVRRWNEEFASPRLVIDTADALFAEFERRHGAALPVRGGDMSPYWEDGALSTAADETAVRAAARRLRQAETLATLTRTRLPAADTAAAWRSVLLWHEHTWGAADSVRSPDRADVVAQWTYKQQFSKDADRRSRALLAAAYPSTAEGHELEIVNTTSWRRAGLVLLTPDLSRRGDRVRQGSKTLPSQRLRDGHLAVWIDDVPALGSVRIRVEQGRAGVPRVGATAAGDTLDNGRLRVTVGRDGAVARLQWAEAPGRDLSGGGSLFRYLYVDGLDPARALTSPEGTLAVEDAGPLVATIRAEVPAGGARTSTRRIRLVAGMDAVLAEIALDKIAVRTKESGHVSLSVEVPGGVVRADEGEAVVRIGEDQLPGSCRDFIGVQSAIDVSGASLGVSLVSLDAPLVEIGALTDERQPDGRARRWRETAPPGTALYAYLFNNYWHTNYKADQAGPLTFRFVASPHAAFDPLALRRLSDEHDFPLLAFPTDGRRAARPAPVAFRGDPIMVSSMRAREADGAIAIVLHNPSARAAQVAIEASDRAGRLVEANGGMAPARELRMTLPARGTRTVVLTTR